MPNLFYFGLEAVTNRYTQQLSKIWMPAAFTDFKKRNENRPLGDFQFIDVAGGETDEKEITTGAVLDYIRRSKYSFDQINNFLQMLDQGKVNNGDIVYLQDFWTPGIEAIPYAADQLGIKLRFYSMLHAQSVDEYDFTHKMKDWIKWFELGLDYLHRDGGIFVGSTCHKVLLQKAGFKSPIHVVSLPIQVDDVLGKDRLPKGRLRYADKQRRVIFSSRLDSEKQPFMMLNIAERVCQKDPNAEFMIVTSNKKMKSSVSGVMERIKELRANYPNFEIRQGVSKNEYYQLLNSSKVQLNTSLQDFVSWTLLEADALGCALVYPRFRSFPECLYDDSLYAHQNVESAVELIFKHFDNEPSTSGLISYVSDVYGRQVIPEIIFNKEYFNNEYNIWEIFGNSR